MNLNSEASQELNGDIEAFLFIVTRCEALEHDDETVAQFVASVFLLLRFMSQLTEL